MSDHITFPCLKYTDKLSSQNLCLFTFQKKIWNCLFLYTSRQNWMLQLFQDKFVWCKIIFHCINYLFLIISKVYQQLYLFRKYPAYHSHSWPVMHTILNWGNSGTLNKRVLLYKSVQCFRLWLSDFLDSIPLYTLKNFKDLSELLLMWVIYENLT